MAIVGLHCGVLEGDVWVLDWQVAAASVGQGCCGLWGCSTPGPSTLQWLRGSSLVAARLWGSQGSRRNQSCRKGINFGAYCLHSYLCLYSTVKCLEVQGGQSKLGHQLKRATAETGLGDKNTFNLVLIKIKKNSNLSLFEKV